MKHRGKDSRTINITISLQRQQFNITKRPTMIMAMMTVLWLGCKNSVEIKEDEARQRLSAWSPVDQKACKFLEQYVTTMRLPVLEGMLGSFFSVRTSSSTCPSTSSFCLKTSLPMNASTIRLSCQTCRKKEEKIFLHVIIMKHITAKLKLYFCITVTTLHGMTFQKITLHCYFDKTKDSIAHHDGNLDVIFVIKNYDSSMLCKKIKLCYTVLLLYLH